MYAYLATVSCVNMATEQDPLLRVSVNGRRDAGSRSHGRRCCPSALSKRYNNTCVTTRQGRRNRSGWSGGRRTNISPNSTSLFNRKALVPATARTHLVKKYNECKH